MTMLKNIVKIGLKIPILKDLIINLNYKNEIRLIQEKPEHVSQNAFPSIIHFTFNKSASQFVKKLLFQLAYDNSMTRIALNDFAFYSKFPYLDHLSEIEMAKYSCVFKSKGFIYSAFGGFVSGIDYLEKYNLILTTRDPRDMLVSGYYSIAYSHERPPVGSSKRQVFDDKRTIALKMDINDYVLQEAEHVFGKFSLYRDQLIKNSGLHLTMLKYEEMISDFTNWLDDLEKACGLRFKPNTRNQIISEQLAKKSL
ncbi:MAG: hypothetical protein ACJA2C_002900, partial [Marinoscillum sp.]